MDDNSNQTLFIDNVHPALLRPSAATRSRRAVGVANDPRRPDLARNTEADSKAWSPGPELEGDRNLLFILLSSRHGATQCHAIAGRLLERFGSLAGVVSASPSDLCRHGGLSGADILSLKAIQAAAVRLVRTELDGRSILVNRQSLIEYLVAALSRESRECFHVLFLDTRNRLLADEVFSFGTDTHPREVLRRALELNSTALVLVHNHPSGDPMPSELDVQATAAMVTGAAALSIVVHDHIIVARHGFSSLRDLGLLPKSSGTAAAATVPSAPEPETST